MKSCVEASTHNWLEDDEDTYGKRWSIFNVKLFKDTIKKIELDKINTDRTTGAQQVACGRVVQVFECSAIASVFELFLFV